MDAVPPVRLDLETGIYESNKSEWLKTHRDEYVVIRGTDLLGFFSDFHTAYRIGVENYGIDTAFLVKRVVPQEPVFVVF